MFPEAPSDLKKKACVQMLESLPDLLPCDTCGDHFKNFIEASDLQEACRSRATLSLLLCRAHNRVNEQNGKDTFPCEEAVARYSTSALCSSSSGGRSPGSSLEGPDLDSLLESLRESMSAGMSRPGNQGVCLSSACNS
jgi:hypothetical protein